MRILGIDPGYATIGYGIIEYDNFRFKTISYGAITTTPDKKFADRLNDIFDDNVGNFILSNGVRVYSIVA